MLHSQLWKFGRQKGKMGFSKQQGEGIFWVAAWQTPSLVHRGAPQDRFLCSFSAPEKYQGEETWQDIKKKVGSAQSETSLQPNPQCFVSFWGSFLHLFNPSPFGSQHCSNRKNCFVIKKPKKCFVLKKMLKQDISTSFK